MGGSVGTGLYPYNQQMLMNTGLCVTTTQQKHVIPKVCLQAYLYNVPNGSRRDQAELQEPPGPAGSVLQPNLFARAISSNTLKTLEFCLFVCLF